jgi:hypothetical protein
LFADPWPSLGTGAGAHGRRPHLQVLEDPVLGQWQQVSVMEATMAGSVVPDDFLSLLCILPY